MTAFEELSLILSEEKLAVVCEMFGGTSIYIPPNVTSKHQRNLDIIADYSNGLNYKVLARKYHVCENTIRRITKKGASNDRKNSY